LASTNFDLVIIGSGPAGQRAAVQATKAGASVALIERREMVGGVAVHAGTIPSKTLREAVMHLRGIRQRKFYGADYAVKYEITLEDLNVQVESVLAQEMGVMAAQLRRNGVRMIYGMGRFIDANTIDVESHDGSGTRVSAEKVIIATGTVPRRPDDIPFDQEVFFDSNFLFSHRNRRADLPRSLIVIGAGVIGGEYASIFATLGTRVRLIDRNKRLYLFSDKDLAKMLADQMEASGVEFWLGKNYAKIERTEENRARVVLEDGVQLESDAVLFAMGRSAFVHPLDLDAIGVRLTDRGLIEVDKNFITSVPNIYAVGDVIGFPALASTSGEQGRMAAAHALGLKIESEPRLFPLAIYTIPEISMVGKTEQALQSEGVPYEQGVAFYKEIAKATMIGDDVGALKMLFHRETRKLLGVHIIGDGASELIHIGQAAMAFGGTIDYFANTVFNYPTLAEAYKVAAFNGINNLKGKATYHELSDGKRGG
jgi:NAD(P) transhydrogenase